MPTSHRLLALSAALLVAAIPTTLRAQGSITIAAGTSPTAQVAPSGKIGIPIVIDMSAATGATNLASLTTTVSWGQARLTFDSVKVGSFGSLTSNVTNAANGSATLSLFSGSGTTTTVTMATMWFTAAATTGGTRILLNPSVAGDEIGSNLLSLILSRGQDVCIALQGLWGDVNADNAVNIIDAQQIARFSVSLSVANSAALVSRGDVTNDNNVNIIDAQQIARFSVGLSAAARVNTQLSVAPTVASIAITQSTPSVAAGQTVQLTAIPRDASNADLTGCVPITWASSDITKATVSTTGLVSGVASGAPTITASAGGQNATVVVTVAGGVSGGTVTANAGNGQFATAGSAVAIAPSVLVVNGSNAPVAGASVTFSVASGGGSVTGGTATTNASGIATVGSWTLGTVQGTNTLTAAVAGTGVTGNPITFTATGTVGAAATVAIASGDNQVQAQGGSYVAPLTVIVKDASGNPVPGASVTFAVSAGGGSFATNPTSTSISDATGKASAIWTSAGSIGSATVTATVNGLPPVTFSGRTVGGLNGFGRCELTSTGAAYCWGDNGRGQIGDGTTTNRLKPVAVSGGLTFASVAEGSADHACALTSAGAAYCWGSNAYGELGDGTTTDRTAPVQVLGGFTFTQLVVSLNASCGRTTAGAIVCWGWSGFGLFGDGVLGTARSTPVAVQTSGVAFTSIALGVSHICGVATGGTMYCWGLNTSFQLGDGTNVNRTVPTAFTDGRTYASVTSGSTFSCGLTTAGAAFCWGTGAQGQLGTGATASVSSATAVTGGLTFVGLSAASATTCGRLANGTVYCWGQNTSGQVGDGTTTTPRPSPTPVAGGLSFTTLRLRNSTTCARTSNGQPFCWGLGTLGQIGDNASTNRSGPSAVTWVEGTAGVAVSAIPNSTDHQSANPNTTVAAPPSVLVRDFANQPVAGTSVTFTVTQGGGSVTGGNATSDANGIATVGSWTLGPNPGPNAVTATSTGLATIEFGATGNAGAPASVTVIAGDNQVQTLSGSFLQPLQVLVKDAANNPVVGATVTFAVASGGGSINGGSVITTDQNGLAQATWVANAVAGAQTATATVAGVAPATFTGRSVPGFNGYARCELTSAGAAYCWGDNTRGQVGDGTQSNSRTTPTAVSGGLTFASIAEGSADHVCALTTGGQAYCWGYNAFGQIGDGTTTDRNTPTLVPGGYTFSQLSVSGIASCGVTTAGAVVCWGGTGTSLFADGVIGTFRSSPTVVPMGGVTISRIAITQGHACAIATSGAMYCWGLNTSSQLGDGTNLTHPIPTAVGDGRAYASVAVGITHTCAVTTAGAAFCWGTGGTGQIGNGGTATATSPTAVTLPSTVAAITAANNTNCARMTSGAVFCWGTNTSNQIGDGTAINRFVPTAPSGNIVFTSITHRGFTTCGRAAGGQPFCWGINGLGQIGDGTTTQRSTPVPVLWVEGSAGVASSIAISAGNNQGGTAGNAVPIAPAVLVRDFAGTPVVGATVTFSIASGGGSVTGGTTTTNGSGIARVGSWVLGASLGTNTLTATTGAISTTFTAQGTTPASSIAIVTGDNQVTTTNGVYIAPLSVVVKDASNNGVAGVSVTFSQVTGAGTFGGAASIVVATDLSGTATTNWTASGAVGTQTATASVNGLAPLTFTGRSVFAVNGNTRCELTSAGATYCWGDNNRGQIGDGTITTRLVPTAVAGAPVFTSIADGSADHACGLTSTGAAYCWGYNAFGQLGDGTIIDKSSPVAVQGGFTFTQLAVSINASCGRTTAGVIVCWGASGFGLYGDGVQGTVRTAPTPVNAGGLTFSSIGMGQNHVCAIATGGAMYCWGLGTSLQLGNGSATTRTVPTAVNDGRAYASVAGGGTHTCAVTTAGAAFCWGTGTNGQLGANSTSSFTTPAPVTGGLTFASVTAGLSAYTCGRTTAGAAYCWGINSSGQLGDGTLTQKIVPTAVNGGLAFTSLRIRGSTTCARVSAGQPYCWGLNTLGEVGDGTSTSPRSNPIAVLWVEGSAGVPTAMTISGGDGQSATAGAAVTIAPSVTVRDYAGTAVSGVSVTFTVGNGGGSITGGTATTNGSGVATVGSWTLGATVGANQLTATATGLPTITFNATATVAPSSVVLVVGDNQFMPANGGAFLSPLIVAIKDASNAPIQGVAVSFAITSGTANFAGQQATSVMTDVNGQVSVAMSAGATIGAIAGTVTVAGVAPVPFNARIAAGVNGYARCELTTAGAAYCWGDNAHGQIGDGTTTNRSAPTAVGGGLTFASLAEGSADHACGLTSGGAAYCWGSNTFGQVGDGTLTDRVAPTAVGGGQTFTQLTVGQFTTCGRTSAGAIYCWGWAANGLFGDGVLGSARQTPAAINTGGTVFASVTLGQQNACALTAAGTVYCWGLGTSGQLGDGTFVTHSAPTQISDNHTYASIAVGGQHVCGLTTAGVALCWGSGTAIGNGVGTSVNTPQLVSGGLTFASITSSYSTHSCARTSAGVAYCWGSNGNNQLGDGTTTTRLVPTPVLGGIAFATIKARPFSTCGRTSGGQPYCWGFNGVGQLGDGTTTQRSAPVAVNWVEGTPGQPVSIAISGGNNQGAPVNTAVPVAPSVIVRDYAGTVVSGASVTFAIASGGGSVTGATVNTNASGIATVGSWTLGAATGANTLTATVGTLPAVTFAATGTSAPTSIAVVAGDNQVQTNSLGFAAPLSVVVRDVANNPVPGLPVAFAVTSGSASFGTVTATTDAAGVATTTFTAGAQGAITATATVTGVAPITFTARSTVGASGYARCELNSAGKAYCWGDNGHGQVGDGTTTNRAVPTAVSGSLTFASVAEGSADHACALTSAGAAYCWGLNTFGQVGDGTIVDKTTPVAVPGGFVFTKLAVSYNTTCGVTSAGALMCWGWSGYGVFGDGVQGTVHTSPTPVSAGGVTFSSIAIGRDHLCAVATTGTLYCWGLGTNGQLGAGNTITRTTPTALADGRSYASVSIGSTSTCGVTTAGIAFCWGAGGNGTLGNNSTTQANSPVAVAGGLTFSSVSLNNVGASCGRTTTGLVYCWGSNTSGQLGDGTTTQRFVPTPTIGSINFASVSVHTSGACGRASTGQPFCWGIGGSGQIGDNANTQRTVPTSVVWVEGTPGTAVTLVVNAGNNQSATAGSAVSVAPSVIARDYAGALVTGANITFNVTSGGGAVTGSPAATLANGIATVGSWTLGAATGVNTLTATGAGLPTLIFTATGTVAPGSVTVTSGNSQVVPSNSAFVLPLAATVKDASNAAIQGVSVTFAITSGTANWSGATSVVGITDAAGLASPPSFTGGSTVGPVAGTVTVAGLAPVPFTARIGASVNGYARCELTTAGAAYCWGDNTKGQVGDNTTTNRSVPTAVAGGLTFASIAEGVADHVCGLTSAGAAYCWGSNSYGQLGDGTTTDRPAPVLVGGAHVFTQLAVGEYATCGLTGVGNPIYCWGWTGYGMLGQGGVLGIAQLSPASVTTVQPIVSNLTLGQTHACALTNTGGAVCWGAGSFGQLGDNTFASHVAPTAVNGSNVFASLSAGVNHTCGLTTAGAAMCWGSNLTIGNGVNASASIPTAVSGGLTFASLSSGNGNSCARTSAGVAYCWGQNTNGQIGDNTVTQRLVPTAVLGGINFASLKLRSLSTCGRISGGQPYCWGIGSSGQNGDGTTSQRTTPVAVSWVEGTPGVAVSVFVNGGNLQSASVGTAVAVAPSVVLKDYLGAPVVGTTVTFAVASGGGSVTGATTATTNASGIATLAGNWTLGSSPGTNTLTASAPGVPVYTFTATGSVAPASITIFSGDQQVQTQQSPVPGPLTVTVKDAGNNAVAGASVTFAVTSGGGSLVASTVSTDVNGRASATWTLGTGAGNQMVTATVGGLAPLTFTARSVPFGTASTQCERSSTGAAYCWGDNAHGQVGDGTSGSTRLTPVAVTGGLTFSSIADGSADHACALTSAGAAYCWGSNAFGQLGDNSIIDRSAPVAVQGGLTFTQLAVSANATCGRTSTGTLYCWGSTSYSLFGDGVLGGVRMTPGAVTAPGLSFTNIQLAPTQFCGIITTGALYCWGFGGYGALGTGSNLTTVPTALNDGRTYSAVTTGSYATCGLTTAGFAFCWGNGGSGTIGNGTNTPIQVISAVSGGRTYVSISAGINQNVCARTSAGQAYCWGANGGVIGDGTLTDRNVPTPVLGGLSFTSLSIRGTTSCGRTSGGQPYCWGANTLGQAGTGNTNSPLLVPTATSWIEGTPGVAVSMVINGPNNQSASAGTAVATAPSVIVKDFAGNPVAGVAVNFVIGSGGGSVTGGSPTTNASGIATVGSWTMGSVAGSNTLQAAANGLPVVTFTATGSATPSSITALSGDNQVQSVGGSLTSNPTVLVKDASNNPIVGQSVTFQIASGGGFVNGTSASTYTGTTDALGRLGVPWILGNSVGTQTLTATVLGLAPLTFTSRAVGAYNGHARCELLSTGAAYCWGDNTHGQVGDGTSLNVRVTPVAVSGGLTFASLADGNADHMCGLTSAGAAYCWGSNGFGELGDGTIAEKSTPVAVTGGLTFTQLSVSVNATCGRTSGGSVYCWGSSGYGLWGDGALGATRVAPYQITAPGLSFTNIQIAKDHACGIITGGAAYCWGYNGNGAVGDATNSPRTVPTALGDGRTYSSIAVGGTANNTGNYSCGLTTAGLAYCWGVGASGQLGTGGTSSFNSPQAVSGARTYTSIGTGMGQGVGITTCARTSAGQVYCWGQNSNGAVGDGTFTNRNVPTLVLGGLSFTTLSVRGLTPCARTSTGQPYCWGYNSLGAVGDGQSSPRTQPTASVWPEGTSGVPVRFVYSGTNSYTAAAGTAVSPKPAVLVTDYAGTPVSGVTVTFSIASGGGSITGGTTTTNASGIATIGSWTLGTTPGTNTLTVVPGNLPPGTYTATSP